MKGQKLKGFAKWISHSAAQRAGQRASCQHDAL